MITYNGGLMVVLDKLAVKDDADLEAFFIEIAPKMARMMIESRISKSVGAKSGQAKDSATVGGTYNSNGSWSVNGSYTIQF